jgi:hypothetical protein
VQEAQPAILQPTADFDVLGYEDEDDDKDENGANRRTDDNHGNADNHQVNAVIAPVADKENAITNPAINHCFTGGSPELDSLVELYSMLDKRGVANALFDKITRWAWLNARTLEEIQNILLFGSNPRLRLINRAFFSIQFTKNIFS